jgi:hypothetical protein
MFQTRRKFCLTSPVVGYEKVIAGIKYLIQKHLGGIELRRYLFLKNWEKVTYSS